MLSAQQIQVFVYRVHVVLNRSVYLLVWVLRVVMQVSQFLRHLQYI
jgi:hypothetical protein